MAPQRRRAGEEKLTESGLGQPPRALDSRLARHDGDVPGPDDRSAGAAQAAQALQQTGLVLVPYIPQTPAIRTISAGAIDR